LTVGPTWLNQNALTFDKAALFKTSAISGHYNHLSLRGRAVDKPHYRHLCAGANWPQRGRTAEKANVAPPHLSPPRLGDGIVAISTGGLEGVYDIVMSVLPPKADINHRKWCVRFGPLGEIADVLLDHLVGSTK
jgi:hypothetical protein